MFAFYLVKFLVVALVVSSTILAISRPLLCILEDHFSAAVAKAFYQLGGGIIALVGLIMGVPNLTSLETETFHYYSNATMQASEGDWFVLMYSTGMQCLYGILPILIVTGFTLLVLTAARSRFILQHAVKAYEGTI